MKRLKGKNLLSMAVGFALLGGLGGGVVRAEAEAITETPVYELTGITVEAKRPDWETKLSPGTVSVIHPEEFKGEQKTLPDLLLTVPGVHVREVNGKGQYTTVTMRGSTAAQVGVFIDGVLANLGGDSAVDLSTIPVKNIERVEVYRGYIPSRFGGTYIGGVINIVTKKPEKTNISLELGKSSYGGRKGSLEVTMPLGNGTLMLGTNYESSDGDFKYQNYAASRYVPLLTEEVAGFEQKIGDFNSDKIDQLTKEGQINPPLIQMSQDEIEYYKANTEAWLGFVRGDGEESLEGAIRSNQYNYAEQVLKENAGLAEQQMIDLGLKDKYLQLGSSDWLSDVKDDWINDPWGKGLLTEEEKQNVTQKYGESIVEGNVSEWTEKADPEKAAEQKENVESLKEKRRLLKEAQNASRWRKYNDYEKTDTIIKWQNENWMVKGTYNKIDRHLPDSVWGGDAGSAVYSNGVDLSDHFWYDSRRQKIENTGFMVQNRHQSGKLEWGWMVDYLHSDKKYRAEHVILTYYNEWENNNIPLREWSRYKSNKYTAQVDGGYKINERNMLDFLVNYSKERMTVNGSNMDKVLSEGNANTIMGQIRNKYDQELFNIQLQDSITLDKKGSWIFTPSIRYNRSKIVGYSDGKRFGDGFFKWIHPKDSQTNSKVTWQMALKKEFNENFTMRMTGGTYYRLLNMSEIAGDGAGVLPCPANYNGDGATFPVPEEGKQFDISAILHGKALGAENATTLTWFWRDSTNMLQLSRAGKDYWCYFNDNKGKAHGIELQSSFRWEKIDLDLQLTYLDTSMKSKYTPTGDGYSDVWATYQPEWEGNIRVTYRPTEKFSLFAEGHYTGEYFTNRSKSLVSDAKMSGSPIESVWIMNGGLKWKPHKDWQLTFGCNDIFNDNPKIKIRTDIAFMPAGYLNPEFPLQGRTYYASVRYQF